MLVKWTPFSQGFNLVVFVGGMFKLASSLIDTSKFYWVVRKN